MAVYGLQTRNDVALLIARGTSVDQAARDTGVSARTIRRWREEPDFENEIQTARRAILAEAVAALGAAVRDAVTALHQALKDPSPGIRVRAASVLLSSLPAISEHAELNERLAALEAAAEDRRAA
ncbi:helix-turn-helix domain-containing protein [Kitasatospora sp. NPDC056327]|uniref:helix-turn-helix domain-containing protein n=1 Tax=Kitasatospora sp. NPDC056327 TaxID=3345785 RepID=UPI0035DDC29F